MNRRSLFSIGFPFFLALSPFSFGQQAKTFSGPSDTAYYFDLPRQPLKHCLLEFAIQSQLTIVIPPSVADQIQSKPLIGRYQPETALDILLSRTPLEYKVVDGVVVIAPKKKVEQIEIDDATVVEEVIVTATVLPYRYNTISQTRLMGNISSFDSSRYINVVPDALLQDQQPEDIATALRNSASITPADGLADTNDDFFIRGFPRFGLYVDGFRLSAETGVKQMLDNVQRVEILKGPSTLMLGQSEPGGVVNVVRKKPMDKFRVQTKLKGGSEQWQQGMLDINTPDFLSLDAVNFRLVTAFQGAESFRGVKEIQRAMIAPSLTWQPNEKHRFTASYEGQQSEQIHNDRTVILTSFGETQELVSLDAPPNQKSENYQSEYHLVDVGWRYDFAENLSFNAHYFGHENTREGVRATRSSLLTSGVIADPGATNAETVAIQLLNGIVIPRDEGTTITIDNQSFEATVLGIYDEVDSEFIDSVKLSLEGYRQLWNIENDFQLGLSVQRNQLFESLITQKRSDIQSITELPNVSSRGNDIVTAVIDNSGTSGEFVSRTQERLYDEYGLYVFNNARLNDRWWLSFGGRYSYTLGDVLPNGEQNYVALNQFNGFSSEFGLKYEPLEDLGLFLNYSEGFKSNYQIDDFTTLIAEPELSDQIELGVKSYLPNDLGLMTMSLYRIRKDNIVEIGFTNGLREASLSGRQRVIGFDSEAVIQLSSSWEMIGSYGWLQAEILEGENAGRSPRMTAELTGSAYVNYTPREGWAEGVSMSLGGYLIGDRFANDENDTLVHSFYVVDFMAEYAFDWANRNITAQLSVKNLLNETYTLSNEFGIRDIEDQNRRVYFSVDVLW